MATLELTIDEGVAAEPAKRGRRLGLLFWMAIGWMIFMIAVAIFAPVLPLPSPTDMDMLERRAPFSVEHWLGTDGLGRDELSRLIYGARISLVVGLCAPVIGLTIGGALGMLAGYFRGRFESAVVGSMDVLLAFPPLILAMAVTAYLGQSILNLTLILGFLGVPAFMRVARAATLDASSNDYVEAARAIGNPGWRVAVRHVLPNIVPPILVQGTLAIAAAIIAEASLSFLGLGQQPPAPSWGSMLNSAQRFLSQAPWLAVFPGLAIFLAVLSFNLVGDGLRDALDPRGR